MMRRRVKKNVAAAKAELQRKCTVEGWVLPKQESSWARGHGPTLILTLLPPTVALGLDGQF